MKLPKLNEHTNAQSETTGWPSFARMVDDDIRKCEELLDNEFDIQKYKLLHIELTAKYNSHLNDIGADMYGCYRDGKSFDTDALGKDSLTHNLFVLKNRLIAFKSCGYKNRNKSGKDNGISIQNTLTATQTQIVNITFEEVKRQIKDMTGLSDTETKEVLNKIDEIKAVVESSETKKTKWQKIKPTLAWIGDKSVDVGIAILPLLLKIGGGT